VKSVNIYKQANLGMEGQVEDFVKYWLNERHALEAAYKSTTTQFPDVDAVLNQVYELQGSLGLCAGKW
jgi:hypothetical protein